MLAASLADLDGLGVVMGLDSEAYQHWHHRLSHNALAAVLVSAGLSLWTRARLRGFWLYLALFHMHLALDYVGSGPGWAVLYGWPFLPDAATWFECPYAWPLRSWQNLTAGGILLAWTLAIAVRQGRTPLEALMPSLDRQLVEVLRRWTGCTQGSRLK